MTSEFPQDGVNENGEYLVDEKLKKNVLDTKAVRMIFERSDHDVVLVKIKIKGKLEHDVKNGKGKVSKILPSEGMNRKNVRV